MLRIPIIRQVKNHLQQTNTPGRCNLCLKARFLNGNATIQRYPSRNFLVSLERAVESRTSAARDCGPNLIRMLALWI